MPDPEPRFTGTWPPPSLWERYPNWETALDEEGLPGQDETTLRPSTEAEIVDPAAAFTAGDATQADGTQRPALIELDAGAPLGVSVFLAPNTAWSVRLLGRPARWTSIIEDWLPVDQRQPSVSLRDLAVFPLEVRFRLPHVKGQLQLTFRILPEGAAQPTG